MRQPVPFGKYLLLDRISVGGMAEVFKAKSYGVEGFEKIIAIKRILPTMGEDRDFIKMFIDEAKIAGQLAHANICQIFELGRIDGSHFIAMEYIWGKDLLQIQNRLRKLKQAMPVPMACFTIGKVLEGLDYAHRKRDPLGRPLEIVHRDCSPQNVLVSYEGEVKVIDFGIAKATSRNSRTMAGVLKGKFGYMSPEQVRGLPLDRRSDIFALGTMLYECLSGDRLFQGETDFSTLEKVRNVDIRPPREINPNIPVAVEAVIMKALAKDVEERYQWCSEMLADLQAFLMSQDVVFTAKSLSSWLKEVFSGEIDRERQLLEQYKRVGRDGLIAGVPAAEAKLDVVESLGEAGPVEGDPTTLGSPNFDDVEHGQAQAPEIGPAPGSPATHAATPGDGEDPNEDFGEEVPTEIFGEIDHGANPAAAAAAAAMAAVRTAGTSPGQTTRPAKASPSRAATLRGESSQGMAPAPVLPAATAPRATPPGELGGYAPPPAAQPSAQTSSQQIALGAAAMAAPAMQSPAAGAGRTLLGASPPPGLPNYAHGYPAPYAPYAGQQGAPPAPLGSGLPTGQGAPPHGQGAMAFGSGVPAPSGALPAMPGYGATGPIGPPMMSGAGQPMMPSPGMAMSGAPSGPSLMMQGYPGAPYQMGHPPYGHGSPYSPVPPVEQVVVDGKKRSSIARDVAIGVAIAALVLGGFLVVKFLMLDSEPVAEPPVAVTTYATLRPALPAGETASLFVDDRNVATVRDGQEFQVQPGQRKVKLVAKAGTCFEHDVVLEAGKAVTLACPPPAAAVPQAASPVAGGSAAAADAAGAAPGSAAAVASVPAGSAAGADRPVPDKTDRMPVEQPARPADAAGDKPAPSVADKAIDKPATDKPTMDRPATDKPAADRRPVDRPAARPAPAADDDALGTLHGGVKPGNKKAADVRKSDEVRGYLTAITRPVAQVLVDGTDTGLVTPITGRMLPLAPGKHKIVFVHSAGKAPFTVTIVSGETFALNKDLR